MGNGKVIRALIKTLKEDDYTLLAEEEDWVVYVPPGKVKAVVAHEHDIWPHEARFITMLKSNYCIRCQTPIPERLRVLRDLYNLGKDEPNSHIVFGGVWSPLIKCLKS